jgi:hypothetical protein
MYTMIFNMSSSLLKKRKLTHLSSPGRYNCTDTIDQIASIITNLNSLKLGSCLTTSLLALETDPFTSLNLDKHQEILDWLTPITYKAQLSYYIHLQVPGTGQWLLDSEEYIKWTTTTSGTLFCPGIPGTGKTMLSSIVVRNLQEVFSADETVGICYIYFNSQQKDQQTLEQVISNFLKQLSHGRNSTLEILNQLYGQHEERKTRPSIDELSQALRSVIEGYSRVFIIVDALDECDSSSLCRSGLISELKGFQSQFGSNILVTSRPLPDIVASFKSAELLEIRAVDDDISSYIDHRLMHFRNLDRDDLNLIKEVKQIVLEYADGVLVGYSIIAQ